jgi:hypothetical protein
MQHGLRVGLFSVAETLDGLDGHVLVGLAWHI